MDWISNVFVALLLTDITGTIFFLVGELFRKLWLKDEVRSLRFQTLVILISYCVPFVYLILYGVRWFVNYHKVGLGYDGVFNPFYSTPKVGFIFAILGYVWLALFLILLSYRLYRRYRWREVCKGNIPEEDAEVQRVFDTVCEDLGISGKINLYRNDSINVPCATYYHGPVVILPLKHYSRQEAYVILYHELCHYLEKDILLKGFGILVTLLHVFNPAAHVLLRQLDLLCEFSCDRLACKKGNGAYNEREYFQVIFNMLLAEGQHKRYSQFALVDTELNYERRVLSMKKYREQKCVKRGTAIVLSACFLLGSSMTAIAAGDGMSKMYEAATVESREMGLDSSEGLNGQELLEIIKANDLNPEDVIIVDDGISLYGNIINVDWTVPAGRTLMTTGFREEEGDTVIVAIKVDPEDIEIEVGLKIPGNTMRAVVGKKDIEHTFEIYDDGRYYFYMANWSDTDVRAWGSVVK